MSYDDWKMTAPESDDEVCVECPVCTGEDDAPPCSLECEQLVFRANFLARQEEVIEGLYRSARTSLRLAQRYRDEEGPRGRRERECVERIRALHDVIRSTRAMCATDVDAVLDVALRDDFLEAA